MTGRRPVTGDASVDMYGILVNGTPLNAVSVTDRGLQYGDGLFETIAVRRGQPLLWERHLRRLLDGCRSLGIAAPAGHVLRDEALRLCHALDRGVLKIIVTRGEGGRGYSPRAGGGAATRILSTHPWPDYPRRFYEDGVAVRVCDTRLARRDALGGIKHLNRLEQVMARGEWNDPDIPEGLMLDHGGHVIEGTMSNLFLILDGELVTPAVTSAGVAGVMRALVLDVTRDMDIGTAVREVPLHQLRLAREVFLCNSVIGIWPVRAVDQWRFRPGPVTRHLADIVAGTVAQPGPAP